MKWRVQRKKKQHGCRVSSVSQDRKWTCLKICGSHTRTNGSRTEIKACPNWQRGHRSCSPHKHTEAELKINMAHVTCFNPHAVMLFFLYVHRHKDSNLLREGESLISHTSQGRDTRQQDPHSCTRSQSLSNQHDLSRGSSPYLRDKQHSDNRLPQ